jgi:O-antigen ligase
MDGDFDMKTQETQNNSGLNYYVLVLALVFIILGFISKWAILLYPIIILVLTIRKIEDGLAFIIFTAGISFLSFYPDNIIGPLQSNSIQVIGMILFSVIGLFKLKKIIFRREVLFFIFFLAYVSISIIFTDAINDAIRMYGKFILIFLLLLLFSNFNIKFEKLLKLISLSGLISVIFFNFIYYYILKNPIIRESLSRMRLEGGSITPTAYALFLGICFLAAFLYFNYSKNKSYLGLAGLYLAYIFATYSRAAAGAILIVVTIFWIYKKNWMILLITYGVIFVILINYVAFFFLMKGAAYNNGYSQLDVITSGRASLWSAFYNQFKEKPLFGLGFEHTTSTSEDLVGIEAIHSDPLKILFDLGLIGFGLYSLFVLGSIYNFIKLSKTNSSLKYILLFFLFYLITSLVGNNFNYPQCIGFTLFVLLGLSMNKESIKMALPKINKHIEVVE